MNRFVFLLGLTLTFFLPAIFHAQGHDGLNPNAQAAFDRGVAASDQSDWTRALVEFTEAQKMAPTNPKILYNLGFAHAHLGNQIAAVAWLHAYIAAVPTGSNVPKVQLEIAKLEGIARSEEESIFERAIEAANLLKPDLNASDLKRLVKLVAGIAGEAGYSQGFGPIADIEPILRQDSADSYWYHYARTQAQDGDIDGARKSLRKVSDLSSFINYRFQPQWLETGPKYPPILRQDAEDEFWEDRLGGPYSVEGKFSKSWNVDFQSLCKIIPLISDAKKRKQALQDIRMNFDRAYEEWFWSSPVKIWASFAQDDVPESPQLDKILQVPPDQIPEKLASAASHYYGRELLRIRALDKRLSDHVGHSRDENINWSFCGN